MFREEGINFNKQLSLLIVIFPPPLYFPPPQLMFHLSGETKPRELHSSRQDSVEIISLITAQLKNVFPKTPLE